MFTSVRSHAEGLATSRCDTEASQKVASSLYTFVKDSNPLGVGGEVASQLCLGGRCCLQEARSCVERRLPSAPMHSTW